MRNLTIRTADNLFWLGRYLQRTEILVKEALNQYDNVIDRDFNSGKDYFARLGIDLDYKNSKDFLNQATFGEHESSIENSINFARENATMIRDLIKDETFGAINDFYNQVKLHKSTGVTPHFLDEMLHKIDIVWGIMLSSLHIQKPTLFIQFGQTVEMVDLKIRLYGDIELVSFDIEHLSLIGKKLNPEFDCNALKTDDINQMQQSVNKAICSIINYES